jgi:hypothetical protein
MRECALLPSIDLRFLGTGGAEGLLLSVLVVVVPVVVVPVVVVAVVEVADSGLGMLRQLTGLAAVRPTACPEG